MDNLKFYNDLQKFTEVNQAVARVAIDAGPGAKIPVAVSISGTGTVSATKLLAIDAPILSAPGDHVIRILVENPKLSSWDLSKTPEQKQAELNAWYESLTPDIRNSIAAELAKRQAAKP